MPSESSAQQTLEHRLERLRARTLNDAAEDPQRVEALLAERTARLARRPREDGAQAAVLTLRIGAERYGIELERVAGVVSGERLHPLPGSAPELAGILERRGELVAVADLARLLGGHAARDIAGRVVLLRDGARRLGMRVDGAEGVAHLDLGALAPAGESGDRRLLRGMAEGCLAILDADLLVALLNERDC